MTAVNMDMLIDLYDAETPEQRLDWFLTWARYMKAGLQVSREDLTAADFGAEVQLKALTQQAKIDLGLKTIEECGESRTSKLLGTEIIDVQVSLLSLNKSPMMDWSHDDRSALQRAILDAVEVRPSAGVFTPS